MPIETSPLPIPFSAGEDKLKGFGREVRGISLRDITGSDFEELESLLYKHSILVFKNIDLTAKEQYMFTKRFDKTSENYGHGNRKIQGTKSILNALLKSLPSVPQVQLIGNGTVIDHEGFKQETLRHPHHKTFHKTQISDEDERAGYTRFYRWHMDAALYEFEPPKVTTLYALKVPQGPRQIVRYDDGTGDVLSAPLAATAFTSGINTFNILPPPLKSLAVRSRVRYAPHPFIWMAPARAIPTGNGLESDGLETPLDELPSWEESKVKVYPMVWKNPVTGSLHYQVHGCAAMEIMIDPVPPEGNKEGALYPEGAHLTDLKEVRRLIQTMQRPGLSPNLVYPHEWEDKDFIVFYNRGVFHSAVGSLTPDQVRVYHQCNLAASDAPLGPSPGDVEQYV